MHDCILLCYPRAISEGHFALIFNYCLLANSFKVYIPGIFDKRRASLSLLTCSGEASPTIGHANANFPVFIDRIRNQFLKK